MAVVPWTVVVTPFDGGGVKLVKWEGLAANDTGKPFAVAAYPDKTVQLVGTFGGNILIEGSMNPVIADAVYATLNDPQGNALSAISAARIENILEHVYLVRPSAGAGVSAVDVWLLLSNVRG